MTEAQAANLKVVLLTLAITGDDLRRVGNYAKQMMIEGRTDDHIAEALRAELLVAKRMLNSAQITVSEIMNSRDQLGLAL